MGLWRNYCASCVVASTDLAGANLKGAVLVGANLKGAVLVGAKLEFASLDGSDMTGVLTQLT
ncbi:MAG: hypothetical protein EXR00_08215 [Alphaproteobacteria bacterium]|nr:hypothetical protein [Alphaproteobacteria bacterium]